jgi:hypothetical protein
MWWLLVLACDSGAYLFEDNDGDGVIGMRDCDDADPEVHPYAPERCDPPWRDEDCDGRADESDAIGAVRGWADRDGDGWGQGGYGQDVSRCDAEVVSHRSGDCDDADPDVFPGAPETCDDALRDENCDGRAEWLADADGDGWGGPPAAECSGAVHASGDCDDADAAVSPAGVEVCGNGSDDDCDENALPCAFAGVMRPEDAVGGLVGEPLASGDLDGDGAPDLVTGDVTDEGVGTMRVYFGPIAPGSEADVTFAWTGGPRSAALLDLDGDGALDLASVRYRDREPAVEVRYGPIGSGPAVAWAIEGLLLGVQDAGDPDGDGRAELLVRSEGHSWLVQGRPNGATVSEVAHVEIATTASIVGDLDGDGLADLGLLGMPSPCAFGVVHAPFAPVVGPSDAHHCRYYGGWEALTASAVGDADDDGFDDLVVGFHSSGQDEHGESSYHWTGFLLSGADLGEGALSDPIGGDGTHRVGDLDADGLDDLLLFGSGSSNSAETVPFGAALELSGGGRASFWPYLGLTAVPAADYDGDGTIDLLLGDGQKTWWLSATGEGW